VFKLIPNCFPSESLASIVDETFIDVNMSIPFPIVENLSLKGILFPFIGFLL
jgi:hypothetical protein